MGFQIVLTLLISVAIIRLIVQFYEKRINSFFFFFFMSIWCSVIFLAWNPAFLNKIGGLLGIPRGATVLVYIGLFLLFYYVFVSIIRFYILEQDINKLVRKNAVDEFLKKYNMKNKE
ncbi:MAG: DUF2304 domain-containing protein [Elusimicrobia bacterium]|nr:DUF2304 domain-containing protein [Elusimicrobiota bacterium]